MYAVINTGGKQLRVSPGESVRCEKIPGEIGEAISFDKVLLTSDGEEISIGKPYLESKVTGHIIRQGKSRKVVVFKYKKRKGYRRKRGHRQDFTLVKIDGIDS